MCNPSTWKEVKKENIVRIFPRLKKSIGENCDNELYFRQQVLLHIPWRDENSVKEIDESWESVYKRNNLEEEISIKNKLCKEPTTDDVEFEDEDEFESDDEAINSDLILSRLGPRAGLPKMDIGKRSVDMNYNWHDGYKKYEQYGTLSDFETFIDKMKKKLTEEVPSNDPQGNFSFSEDQQAIISCVKQQIEILKGKDCNANEKLKRMIIQGKAGTGKSFLIKHLTGLLKNAFGSDSYVLAAPTGVAATLINGKTLHSLFKIPKRTNTFKPLLGDKARNLTNTLKNVKFVILDEYSMVGCTTLHMIDERCKQGTGNTQEDFGGLNVILLGDIRQLPPVKDSSFFSTPKTPMAKKGKALINNFQTMYFLTTCHRQEDVEFLSVLDNLSEGNITEKDYDILSKRFSTRVTSAEVQQFDGALRLFSNKDDVKEYNLARMAELKNEKGEYVPVINVSAKHNNADGRKGTTDNFEGLEKNLYLAKGCKVMLRQNLWVEKNLTNGTMGVVRDILFAPLADFPSVVLCEFPNYTGPEFIPGTKVIPIKPVLKSWESSTNNDCTRYQFPIALAYACSIHKSQGMTLSKVVVDIGNVEFALGLAYVGLSRVKCLKNLLIRPFPSDRLTKIRNHRNLEMRQDFIEYFKSKRNL